MNALIIVNDPPYDTERAYNALRLALELAKRPNHAVRVFLMAGAVACARREQRTAGGYYNLETMLRAFLRRGGEVGLCGTCMDARALPEGAVVEGTHRSSMEELADWTAAADRVVTF